MLQKLTVLIDGDCDALEFIFDEAHATPVTHNADDIDFGEDWSYRTTINWETPTYFSHCTDSEPTLVYDQAWTLYSDKDLSGGYEEWKLSSHFNDLTEVKLYSK